MSFFLLAFSMTVPDLPGQESPPMVKASLVTWQSDQGLSSTSPWLKPGKVDFLYKYFDDRDQYNAMFWTPTLKGGVGILDYDRADSIIYGGGYLRPFAGLPDRGDWILGGHAVDHAMGLDYEGQSEYRFPFGLGAGAGFVERAESDADVLFAKATFRNTWGSWNYIAEIQAQEVDDETSPGGYGALYNDQFMVVGGTDGEQWRSALGWISPTNRFLPMVRPVAEVLYVDTSIGDFDGPKIWFANASLGYRGGFLSHAARLGRAMGPQGLEYGNPLGFLNPTWNRRLDLWELGKLVDFRMEYIRFPNHATTELYECAVYPFQWLATSNWLEGWFAGASYVRRLTGDSPGVLGGFSYPIKFLHFSTAAGYEFDTDDVSVTVGLIDFF